jgi:pyroglutamyl-peptidase
VGAGSPREERAPLLVTGFGPFGLLESNPSAALAEALAAEPDVRSAVLPVAYERAEQRLAELLEQIRPAAVLLFGVHAAPGFRLERVAMNLDDEAAPDEDGAVHRREPICPDAPAAYWSTLPLVEIAEALELLGLPWEWSNHAGGFLCNHAFYAARHLAAGLGLTGPCGLVHVPPPEATALPSQVLAARACLDAVRSALQTDVSADRDGPRG